MVRFLTACIFVFIFSPAIAQKSKEVILMDFVKVNDGKRAEAMFFYENNWKVYREEALKRKVIKSYELVATWPDSLNNFNLVLITVYRDSLQYAKSEENFAPILKELRPNGPVLLNDLKPNEFRKNVFFKVASPLLYPGKKEN